MAEPEAMGSYEPELNDLEGTFAYHRRVEAEAEALELRAGAERAETFRDFLIGLAPGLVIGVSMSDGAELWGRVLAVGADKLRIAEVGRDGAAHARVRPRLVHDIRIDSVVRVTRDATEWDR